MKLTLEMWLIEFLDYLINHVENYNGGPKYLTYKEISNKFKYRYPFSESKLNFQKLRMILHYIGNTLEKLNVDNEQIPLIQSLVVGEKSKLPLYGINQNFYSYNKLPNDRQLIVRDNEYRRIWDFGNRWYYVLYQFNDWVVKNNGKGAEFYPRVIDNVPHRPFNRKWTKIHRELRNYVANNPQLFKFPKNSSGITEYPLKSGDYVDVVFISKYKVLAIEIITKYVGLDEIENAIYRCIKNKSVLEAESKISKKFNIVRVMIVLEGDFPDELNHLTSLTDIKIKENVKISDKQYGIISGSS